MQGHLHSAILVWSLWRVVLITLSSPADVPNIGVTYLDEGVAFSKKKTVHIKSSSSVSPSFLDVGYGLERFFLFIVSFTPFKTNNSLQHSKERYNPLFQPSRWRGRSGEVFWRHPEGWQRKWRNVGGFYSRRSLSGKESIKRICDSIAAENNAWPYIPLTNGQFSIMNRLYWGDIWKRWSETQSLPRCSSPSACWRMLSSTSRRVLPCSSSTVGTVGMGGRFGLLPLWIAITPSSPSGSSSAKGSPTPVGWPFSKLWRKPGSDEWRIWWSTATAHRQSKWKCNKTWLTRNRLSKCQHLG